MDKVGTENKENVIENSYPPKFMLPSISSLPNPSPLVPFQQMSNLESADAILRGSSAQATFPNQTSLSAKSPIQHYDTRNDFEVSIKQETKPSTPKLYLPNPSTYDPTCTPYSTTFWQTYYSDYSYQSSRDNNSSAGPPYNVSTWLASDSISTCNNGQECLRGPVLTRSFAPYYNNNRHLPPLTSNLHTIINSSPSYHHLSHSSPIRRRKSDTKGDQTSKIESEDLESDNSLLGVEGTKAQRSSIKSSSDGYSLTQENIDPALLNLPSEETAKGEDYGETSLSTPGACSSGKKKGRSNWSRKETRSLISAVKFKHKFLSAAQRNAEKSRIWSDMFSDHCTRYSGRTLKAFKLRWARLVSDYHSVHECIKTGVEPMDFDFYDEMKEIFDDEDVASTTPSNLTEESTVPVLKRKFDEDEKDSGTTQGLEDQTLAPPQSSLLDSSLPSSIFGEHNNEVHKKIKVDEEVKIVLKEVEDTQRKCKKIIEQLKDITK